MKHWIAYLQKQINQMKHVALKDIVQQHFNSEATCLREVFSRDIPEQPFFLPTGVNNVTFHPVLSLIYTYGPLPLIEQLERALPWSEDAYWFYSSSEASQKRLMDYQEAWHLINEIQQKPYHVLETLQAAEPSALQALKKVAEGSLWASLIGLFLEQSSAQWNEEEKTKYIDYFRNPQWVAQCIDLMNLLKEEARCYRALFFHQEVFADKESLSWQSLQEHYLHYSFGMDTQFLQRLIGVFSPQQDAFLFAFLFKILQSHSHSERIAFFQSLSLSTACRFFEYILHEALMPEQEEFSHQLFSLIPEVYSDEDLIHLRKALYVLDEQGNGLFNPKDFSFSDEKGISIETFFLQPEGLAGGGNDFLKKLIGRYRCILLSLTNKELSILSSASLPSYARHFSFDLMDEIKDGHRLDVVRKKKHQLKLWVVDRLVHALLNEAINTFRMKEDDLRAVKALNVIYTYYYESCQMLRLDLFLGAIKHFYGIADYTNMKDSGIESVLFCWMRIENLDDCLPDRVGHAFLYNEESQCIAFIDEYNRIWHWSSEGPLLANAMSTRQIYFDRSGQKIGCLSDTGHFKSYMDPVLSLSTILFQLLPRVTHLKAIQGLRVLIAHALWENNLERLYVQLPDEENHDTINQYDITQCSLYFAVDAPEELPEILFKRLAPFFSEVSLSYFLMKIKNPNNRLYCFHSIMINERLRATLFAERFTSDNLRFLQQHGIGILAYYLEHYDQGIGCSAGLDYFAKSAKKINRYDWLAQSLLLLENKISQGILAPQRLQEIKKYFLATEESAALLLQDFGGDTLLKPIQQAKTMLLQQLLGHFNIEHMIPLLEAVLRKNSWSRSWQYRLFLYLLDTHYESMFGNSTLQSNAWDKNELKLWSFFIRRHMQEPAYYDKKHQLGFKLLSTLLFHCSRSGLTAFFYNGKQSLNVISKYSASCTFLEQLAKNLNLSVSSEWQMLQANAREREENTPLLCIYLLYYSGEKNKVSELISAYITTYAQKKKYIHPVAQWLMLFPQLDVSAVIFDGFQDVIKTNSSLLDYRVLHYMAYFWYQKTMSAPREKTFDLEQAVFCLLKHWGHAKYYLLVSKAGEILKDAFQDKNMQKKLNQLILEAKTELNLQPYQERSSLIHAVIKWCTRSWYYGFMWQNKLSRLVVLCDAEPLGQTRPLAPQVVQGLPLASKAEWPTATSWLFLLEQVIRSTINCTMQKNTPTLFFNPFKTNQKESFADVASQPGVTHV